jgi:polysaccharide export outer membrane protein
LNKVMHPPYRVEPPDILQLDLINAVLKGPYKLRPLDVISVGVANALVDAPISGAFAITADGKVDLGPRYGQVEVAGLTPDQAGIAVRKYLTTEAPDKLKDPRVSVSLVQTNAPQQIRGPHLVRSDGTIALGTYGAVPVAGLTLAQARHEIEAHLREFFQDPEVSLDIVGYNSKVYYVVFDYGGAGQQVVRLPITGNETVLDGIGQVNGLPTVSDFRRMCLSRPAPDNSCPQILPVDWRAIVEDGDTRTNYQILPGDRLLVKANPWVAADVKLARVIAPFERILGVTLLGSSTINSIRTNPNANTTNANR